MHLYIYTDGASRRNPGKSASGYEILDDSHRLLARQSVYNGIRTNNEAEYIAFIEALKRAGTEYGYGSEIDLCSDSELMVKQLRGEYKVKDAKIKAYHSEARALMERFKVVRLTSVPRENRYISRVDAGLNELLDRIAAEGEGAQTSI